MTKKELQALEKLIDSKIKLHVMRRHEGATYIRDKKKRVVHDLETARKDLLGSLGPVMDLEKADE